MMAGIDPHPAVKAISPQAPMIDVWIGDDFFHNGAFRQSYGYDYVLGLESTKDWTPVDYGKDNDGQPVDGFDYFLERGSFAARRERVRRRSAAHLEALPRPSRIRFGLVVARRGRCAQHGDRAHAHRGRLLRPGRHVRAAGGVREARAARHEARELSGARAVAARLLVVFRRGTWATWTSASLSAPSSASASRRSSSRTISRASRASTSRTRRASRPARTRGSTTRTSRPKSRGPRACIWRARDCSAGAARQRRQRLPISAIPPIRFLTVTGPSSPHTARDRSGTTG